MSDLLDRPLLVCTNGDEHTRPALDYGVWLAGLLRAPVIFLGILERGGKSERIETLIAEAAARLDVSITPYEIRMDEGRASIVIAKQANATPCITVIGPLGRPTWRRVVQGRSFRRILSKVSSPIFYTPNACNRLNSILICLGGLEYSTAVEHFCLALARQAGATVTFLHVVEPVTLQYPIAREIKAHWASLAETPTPQGKHLRRALSEAQTANVPAEIKIRHGSIVHEIIEETRSGDYDLIGMGSPYSAHSLRHLYMPNVTAEVAEMLVCPVLTLRTELSAVENKQNLE
jgi:nucleotide-binding universal stress UspA family protein